MQHIIINGSLVYDRKLKSRTEHQNFNPKFPEISNNLAALSRCVRFDFRNIVYGAHAQLTLIRCDPLPRWMFSKIDYSRMVVVYGKLLWYNGEHQKCRMFRLSSQHTHHTQIDGESTFSNWQIQKLESTPCERLCCVDCKLSVSKCSSHFQYGRVLDKSLASVSNCLFICRLIVLAAHANWPFEFFNERASIRPLMFAQIDASRLDPVAVQKCMCSMKIINFHTEHVSPTVVKINCDYCAKFMWTKYFAR